MKLPKLVLKGFVWVVTKAIENGEVSYDPENGLTLRLRKEL